MPTILEKRVRRNIIRNIILGALLGALGFFLLIVLFLRLSKLYIGSIRWDLLEGFSSLMNLVLLISVSSFGLSQFYSSERKSTAERLEQERQEQERQEREKAREKFEINKLSYEIYQAVFARIADPEQEAARRWILINMDAPVDGEDLAEWYERVNEKVMAADGTGDVAEGQEAIKLTLNAFDYIGFIADHYWKMDDDALGWISAPIAKVWERLGPYVDQVQKLRGVDDYYLSAQYIGKLCIEWRASRGFAKETIVKNTP